MSEPYRIALFLGFVFGMYVFVLMDSFHLLKVTENDSMWRYISRVLASGVIGSFSITSIVFLFRLFQKEK